MSWTRFKRRSARLRLGGLLLPVLAAGCIAGAGGAPAEDGISLVFPYSDVAYASIGDYRALARSVAPIYVQVTIRVKAPARMGRDSEPRNRIVSGASGIIVQPEGYVVTAAHIARNTRFEAQVKTVDGREYAARIVHVDADRDLALLRIIGQGFPDSAVERAAIAHVGQAVMAIGTPDNRPGVVTVGEVRDTLLQKRIRYGAYGFADSVELAMHVEPGHSGGPVLNAAGRLVGMIVGFDLRKTASGDYVNTGAVYAIPASEVLDFARQWANPSGNS